MKWKYLADTAPFEAIDAPLCGVEDRIDAVKSSGDECLGKTRWVIVEMRKSRCGLAKVIAERQREIVEPDLSPSISKDGRQLFQGTAFGGAVSEVLNEALYAHRKWLPSPSQFRLPRTFLGQREEALAREMGSS